MVLEDIRKFLHAYVVDHRVIQLLPSNPVIVSAVATQCFKQKWQCGWHSFHTTKTKKGKLLIRGESGISEVQ
jgi:hypothetical protein